MRIIAGSARGTSLLSPTGEKVRPTSDRAKETLFNIVMPKLRDAKILDLYSGSGALGLEALSRGSEKAVFMDANATSLDLAKKNAQKTKLLEQSVFLLGKIPEELRKIPKGPYDLIFADPPYEQGYAQLLLEKIAAGDFLTEAGWLIIEHEKSEVLPERIPPFMRFREKQIGKAKFSFYKYS